MTKGDWLKDMTHQGAVWWVAAIQSLIGKHSKKTKDPKHDRTDTRKMLHELVDLVMKRMPATGYYDENMRACAVLSMVTALWYARVNRAKCFDPRRPVFERGVSYENWLNYSMAMVRQLLDERDDDTFFPGQQWESPFAKSATNGDFV